MSASDSIYRLDELATGSSIRFAPGAGVSIGAARMKVSRRNATGEGTFAARLDADGAVRVICLCAAGDVAPGVIEDADATAAALASATPARKPVKVSPEERARLEATDPWRGIISAKFALPGEWSPDVDFEGISTMHPRHPKYREMQIIDAKRTPVERANVTVAERRAMARQAGHAMVPRVPIGQPSGPDVVGTDPGASAAELAAFDAGLWTEELALSGVWDEA